MEFQNASGVWPESDAAAGVGDGAGNHQRQSQSVALEIFLDRENRGLAVEGVEYGFDEENIGAALDQPVGGVEVGRHQFIEGDISKPGAVDVRRDRGGAVGRAEDAGDKARGAGFALNLVGGGAPGARPRS